MCWATIADSCALLPQQITRAHKISSKENSLYGFQRWNVLLESAEGYLRDFFVSWPLDDATQKLEIADICFSKSWSGLSTEFAIMVALCPSCCEFIFLHQLPAHLRVWFQFQSSYYWWYFCPVTLKENKQTKMQREKASSISFWYGTTASLCCNSRKQTLTVCLSLEGTVNTKHTSRWGFFSSQQGSKDFCFWKTLSNPKIGFLMSSDRNRF